MSQHFTESTEKTTQQVPHRQVNSAPTRSLQGGFHSAILQLQRTLGNRRVAQLIQAKRITPEGRIIGLQRKLTVGAADDHYEQEADQVARQVVSMPDSVAFSSFQQTPKVVKEASESQTLQSKPLPLAASITPFVQRQVGQDDQKNKTIQSTSAVLLSDSFEAGYDVESRINQSKGGGVQLPDSVRSYMEPRFGADFSHVRVHPGSNAIQMNRDVGAQAFTHGSDIYYGAESSPSNLELTAHELTHVVQQSGASIISGKSNKPVQRICSGCEEETKRKIQPKLVVATRPERVQVQFQKTPKADDQSSRPKDLDLDELAKWPDQALDAWSTLNDSERILVTLAISVRYGSEFAKLFQSEARLQQHKQSVNYYYGPGITWITPKKLSSRGFRLAQRDSVHEWWVHPKGDTVTRRWDQTAPTPDWKSSDSASPVEETKPTAPIPEVSPTPPDRNPPSDKACMESQHLSDAICENANRICRIANELGDDEAAQASCQRAQRSCKDAQERAGTCSPPLPNFGPVS